MRIGGFLGVWVVLTSLARGETYTWARAVEETRKANPSLLVEQKRVESSQATLRIVEAGYAPEISGVANISQVGGDSTSGTTSSYGVTADIPIFSGFSTRAAQLSQRKVVEQHLAELASQETRVRADLRTAFANLLFSQYGLELDRSIAERLDRNAKFVHLRYEGGIEARWSFSKADADAKDAHWQIDQSERSLESAKARLAQVMGRKDDHDLIAQGELIAPMPTEDFSALEKSVPDNHPDVRSLQAASESFFEEIRGARSGHWPTLSGNADYLRGGIDTWPTTDTWQVGAGLRFPIYSGGQTVASVDRAISDYQASVASLQSTKLQLKSDLVSAYANYISAVTRVPVSKATLDAAEERAKTIYAQYSAGLKGYLDWEQSQTQLTDAQHANLQEMVQSLLTLAIWEKAIGKDLSVP